MLSLLETQTNYLQNEYDNSRYFLKTLLHYRVKHKSLRCNCSTSATVLDDKTVNSIPRCENLGYA